MTPPHPLSHLDARATDGNFNFDLLAITSIAGITIVALQDRPGKALTHGRRIATP